MLLKPYMLKLRLSGMRCVHEVLVLPPPHRDGAAMPMEESKSAWERQLAPTEARDGRVKQMMGLAIGTVLVNWHLMTVLAILVPPGGEDRNDGMTGGPRHWLRRMKNMQRVKAPRAQRSDNDYNTHVA